MDVNTIYNENCIETMARMPDGFVDLTVTSPPYDNLRTYNGYEFDFEPIARELYRVTKKGGVVVWVVGDATINGSETGTSFRQALYFKEIGFNLHDTMIYLKQNPIPLTHNRYEQCFEYMFVLSKSRPSAFNPLTQNTSTVGTIYRYTQKKADGSNNYATRKRDEHTECKATQFRHNAFLYSIGNHETGSHPAPMPEGLAKDHILSWSNEGDLVYDPFMGSGTTAKAAHQLKRNWIGSEISSEYVELANKRLEPYLAQGTLF